MRTEDDLRVALTLIADKAPAADTVDLRAPGDEPSRRRRRTVIVLAVAATAAAVAIPVFIVTGQTSTAPQPAPSGEQILRTTFEVQAAGWHEITRNVRGTHQSAILENTRHGYCMVTVFEPGRFDRGRIPAGSAELTVRGKPGYYAQIIGLVAPDALDVFAPAPSPSSGPDAPRQWAVVWPYAENAWAASTCEADGDSQADAGQLRRNAELTAAATVTRPRQLRVPFKAGYLPPGPDLVAVLVDRPRSGSGAPAGTTFKADLADLANRRDHLTIEYIPATRLEPGIETLMINGRRATFDGSTLTIAGERFSAAIHDYDADGLSRAELIRIAEQLEFATDPADDSTWFDSGDALPR